MIKGEYQYHPSSPQNLISIIYINWKYVTEAYIINKIPWYWILTLPHEAIVNIFTFHAFWIILHDWLNDIPSTYTFIFSTFIAISLDGWRFLFAIRSFVSGKFVPHDYFKYERKLFFNSCFTWNLQISNNFL